METCLRRSGRSYRLKDAPNHGVFQMNTPLVIFSYLIDFFLDHGLFSVLWVCMGNRQMGKRNFHPVFCMTGHCIVWEL